MINKRGGNSHVNTSNTCQPNNWSLSMPSCYRTSGYRDGIDKREQFLGFQVLLVLAELTLQMKKKGIRIRSC